MVARARPAELRAGSLELPPPSGLRAAAALTAGHHFARTFRPRRRGPAILVLLISYLVRRARLFPRRRVWFTAHAQRQPRLRDRSVVNCALDGRQSLCTRYRAFLLALLPAFFALQRLLAIACRLPYFVRRSLNRAHLCALGNKHLIAVHLLGCLETGSRTRALRRADFIRNHFHLLSLLP